MSADTPQDPTEEATFDAEVAAEPEADENSSPEVETLETETLVEEIAPANPFQEAPEAAQEEAVAIDDVAVEGYGETQPESTISSVKEAGSVVESTSEDEEEREE
jgi:hypothetical protein